MLYPILAPVSLMLCILMVASGDSITTTKSGATSCPPLIGGASEALNNLVGIRPLGHACGKDSVFHYYVCCGEASADCCFRLQTWVIVTLAVCAAVVLTSVVLSLIRCVFCRR